MTWSGVFGVLLTVIAVAESITALLAYRESRRDQKRVDKERLASDDAVALAIHEDLTVRDVLELVGRHDLTDSDSRLLASVRDRSRLKINSMNQHLQADNSIKVLIDRALASVEAKASPEDDASLALAAETNERLGRTSDHTKFTWDSGQPLPKWAMVNKIAVRFARENNIDTVEEFLARFVPEVRAAISQELGRKLDESKVLIGEDKLPAAAVKQTKNFDRLDLDGTSYLVAWEMGLPNVAVGVQIQKPVINRFATEHKYPITQA